MENLIAQIREFSLVHKELESRIADVFSKIRVQKNTTLIEEGKYCKHYYFVEKGIFRSYYLNKGKERTYWFYSENEFFTSWYSFYANQPSFESIEAVEDSDVFVVSKSQFQELINDFREFEKFARCFIEQQYAVMDFITKNFQDLTAKEKYELTMREMPGLDQRAKLGHIASFLGMSQETLSRLRAQK
ncbi:Crp/Fnr family transcriptional regulator [Flagellimonas sp.]|uniref:Crp/Fnr family transcriptional regulator n=1 Tax=Flagellimonas sp. TaxID=2058762 RepID=UPI003B5AA1F2